MKLFRLRDRNYTNQKFNGRALVLVALAFACFALPKRAQATDLGSVLPGGNTADGFGVLTNRTTGGYNTGTGWFSLKTVSSGSFNTAFGAATLFANTGDSNTAIGAAALFSNTTGTDNTATGFEALVLNNIGSQNTATGFAALPTNTTGNGNTAIGAFALNNNTTGTANTAIGDGAGFNQSIGGGNVYIGNGMIGVGGETDHTYIRNIQFTTVSGGGADFVTVDLTSGLLGHLSSSRRYKEYIKPMDKASEAVFALKPVTFRYKKEIDRTQSPAFGLIAEEVAEVNPNLVARNAQGRPESVHYEMVNAMLLNEFLKEHRRVQEQQKEIDNLKAELKQQRTLIQKVSTQLELSKAAPQTVLNN